MTENNDDEINEQDSKIKPEDLENIKARFFNTLKKATGQVPFSEEVVAAFYCATDSETPIKYKTALVSALAYFILPFDTIPDVIPGVGFTDDWGILAAAIAFASIAITDDHRLDACIWLEKIGRCFELLNERLIILDKKLNVYRTGDIEEPKIKKYHKLDIKVQKCIQVVRQLAEQEESSEKMKHEIKRIRSVIQDFEAEFGLID